MAMATKVKKNKTLKIYRYSNVCLAILLSIVFIITPFVSQSATLGLQALSAQVNPSKNFTIRVSVNTQGKAINNAEAVIRFPKDLVEVVSLSSSGSIFSLWVESPSFSNSAGTISFNGGAPNPGFTGTGQILSAVFRAKKVGTANFSFSGAAVRENDGLGTDILSGQGSASVLIIEEKKTEEPRKPEQPETPITIDRVAITSPTHPDSNKWYKEKRAVFNWRIPTGAIASQTLFDQNQNSLPIVLYRPAINTVTIDTVADGVWYFHARFLVNQTWSPVYSYKIQVDTTPPENLKAAIETNSEDRLVAKLSATDQLSQLDYYTLQIDNQPVINVPAVEGETTALLPPISKGDHTLITTVFDKAGNSTTTTENFTNQAEEKILITEYTKEIKNNEEIKAFGVAPANTSIRISLATQEGLIRYYYITSNSTGDFTFISEPIAGGEVYTLWAEVERTDGRPALSSQQVTIRVQDSLWARLYRLMIFLRHLITWNNILLLLLFILAVTGWYKYWRLRLKFNNRLGKKNTVRNLSEMLNKKIKK